MIFQRIFPIICFDISRNGLFKKQKLTGFILLRFFQNVPITQNIKHFHISIILDFINCVLCLTSDRIYMNNLRRFFFVVCHIANIHFLFSPCNEPSIIVSLLLFFFLFFFISYRLTAFNRLYSVFACHSPFLRALLIIRINFFSRGSFHVYSKHHFDSLVALLAHFDYVQNISIRSLSLTLSRLIRGDRQYIILYNIISTIHFLLPTRSIW